MRARSIMPRLSLHHFLVFSPYPLPSLPPSCYSYTCINEAHVFISLSTPIASMKIFLALAMLNQLNTLALIRILISRHERRTNFEKKKGTICNLKPELSFHPSFFHPLLIWWSFKATMYSELHADFRARLWKGYYVYNERWTMNDERWTWTYRCPLHLQNPVRKIKKFARGRF